MKKLTPVQLVWALVAVNLVWRLAWLPVNQGATTDGILQLLALDRGQSLWPPLFTILAHGLGWIPGLGLEGAGRLISILAGALAVIPIEFIGRKLFGLRAAIFGALCYTFTPIALRWGVAPQNDSLFMALWMGCLAAMMMSALLIWPDMFEQGKDKSKPEFRTGTLWLALGSMLGALAALTRYQGMILLPVIFLMVMRVIRASDKAEEKAGINPWISLAPWIGVIGWILFAGVSVNAEEGALATQLRTIGTRAGTSGPLAAFVNFWYVLEQFVMASPYFVTYGIFGFFLYGLLRINFATKRITTSVIVGAWLTVAILLLQSAFHAYQSRYLMPIIPLICVLAGHGMAVWEKRCKDKDARFYALVGLTFAYAIVFSSLVGTYSGRTFSDIKQAGKWIKNNAPESAAIYTIEAYGNRFDPAKLQFWSGRKDIKRYELQPDLNEGDLIVLPSFYGSWGIPSGAGGYAAHRAFLDFVKQQEFKWVKDTATVLHQATQIEAFTYTTFPLLPDIMEETITHTNPLAWYLRYRRQAFQTVILQVQPFGMPAPGGETGAPAGAEPETEPAEPAMEAPEEPAAEPAAEPAEEAAP